MMFRLEHIAAITTPRPCNCLLTSTRFPSRRTSKDPILEYACYELSAKPTKVEEVGDSETRRSDEEELTSCVEEKTCSESCSKGDQNLAYYGAVSHLRIHADTLHGKNSDIRRDMVQQTPCSSLPFGVFDITWISRKVVAPYLTNGSSPTSTSCMQRGGSSARPVRDEEEGGGDTTEPFVLLTACTDGAARLIHPRTHDIIETFPSIHTEMLTSCTPFVFSSGSSARFQLLCTAHGGGVVIYDVMERRVLRSFDGHQFDAWCGAVWPSSVGTSTSFSFSPEDSSGGVEESSLLLSGGDDGVLRFYDLRCSTVCAEMGKMRFDAGVVSISPVLQSFPASALYSPKEDNPIDNYCEVLTGTTPYLLVGSYDESISLIDVRYRKRAIARRSEMGGGVWRTSRCLFPVRAAFKTKLEENPIGETSQSEMASPTVATIPRSNFELFEQNTLPFHAFDEQAEMGGRHATSTRMALATQSYVTQRNILILPLMQRGAAFLPYDVSRAEDEVFAAPQYFFPSLSNTEGVRHDSTNERRESEDAGHVQSRILPCLLQEPLTEDCLVYDTAALSLEITLDNGLMKQGSENNKDGEDDSGEKSTMEKILTTTVATCSFYEKKIDIWRAKCEAKLLYGVNKHTHKEK